MLERRRIGGRGAAAVMLERPRTAGPGRWGPGDTQYVAGDDRSVSRRTPHPAATPCLSAYAARFRGAVAAEPTLCLSGYAW